MQLSNSNKVEIPISQGPINWSYGYEPHLYKALINSNFCVVHICKNLCYCHLKLSNTYLLKEKTKFPGSSSICLNLVDRAMRESFLIQLSWGQRSTFLKQEILCQFWNTLFIRDDNYAIKFHKPSIPFFFW